MPWPGESQVTSVISTAKEEHDFTEDLLGRPFLFDCQLIGLNEFAFLFNRLFSAPPIIQCEFVKRDIGNVGAKVTF
jgi:hypothetical protein